MVAKRANTAGADRALISAALTRALNESFGEYGRPIVPTLVDAAMRGYDSALAAMAKRGSRSSKSTSLRELLGLEDDAEDGQVVEAAAAKYIREFERGVRGIATSDSPGSSATGGLIPLETWTLAQTRERLNRVCGNFDEARYRRIWGNALNLLRGPDEVGSDFAFGNDVHAKWQWAYRQAASNRSHRMVIERTKYVGPASVGTLVDDAAQTPPNEYRVLHEVFQGESAGSWLRSDLVDLTTRHAWEIKPVTSINAAVAQICYLTWSFNCSRGAVQPPVDELSPGPRWPEGILFPVYQQSGTTVKTAFPISSGEYPGLVIYRVQRMDLQEASDAVRILDLLKEKWRAYEAARKVSKEPGQPPTEEPGGAGEGGLVYAKSGAWATATPTLELIGKCAVGLVIIVAVAAVVWFAWPVIVVAAESAAVQIAATSLVLLPRVATAGGPSALKPLLGRQVSKAADTVAEQHRVEIAGTLYVGVPSVTAFVKEYWDAFEAAGKAALASKEEGAKR